MGGAVRAVGPGLAVALLLAAAPLHAQAPDPIDVGQRIRFSAAGIAGRVTGTVLAEDAEALTVKAGRGPVRVRRADIGALEVSTARRRQWKKGMLIGAAVEGTLFAASGIGTPRCRNGDSCWAPPPGLAFGALLGALHGGAIGAFVKSDQWSPVPLERVRVGVSPLPGRGIGLSVSLGF